ncbi:MAG: hypothetical protein GX491_00285 [Chloroflexi bacterium]|nr:hypothetical protein [Chloroflexota bacterium]
MISYEDAFLRKIARGVNLSQDEYDQMSQDLPPEILAAALVQRHNVTQEVRALIEAARLYLQAGMHYEAIEACSRNPRHPELQRIIRSALPKVREDYPDPDIRQIGKLLNEAFLVIDLLTGEIVRYPPLMPG